MGGGFYLPNSGPGGALGASRQFHFLYNYVYIVIIDAVSKIDKKQLLYLDTIKQPLVLGYYNRQDVC
jgi:hypothetical protein